MELNQFRDVDLVIDKANDNFIQRQFVSQGDYRGRTLTVQVTDNGLIGQVPGLMLNLRWQNQASGLADLSAFECIDAENSVFRIEYPEQMMTPGKVVANIQVIQDGNITHLKSFEITVQRLAGEMTGIVGQSEYGALVAVLSDANKLRTDIEVLDAVKMEKGEVLELISNIGSGTPKDTLSSLDELQTKYPDGADAIMLVMDADGIGYTYSWNGSEWVKGVLYTADGVAAKTIDPKTQKELLDVTQAKSSGIGQSKIYRNSDGIAIGQNSAYVDTATTKYQHVIFDNLHDTMQFGIVKTGTQIILETFFNGSVYYALCLKLEGTTVGNIYWYTASSDSLSNRTAKTFDLPSFEVGDVCTIIHEGLHVYNVYRNGDFWTTINLKALVDPTNDLTYRFKHNFGFLQVDKTYVGQLVNRAVFFDSQITAPAFESKGALMRPAKSADIVNTTTVVSLSADVLNYEAGSSNYNIAEIRADNTKIEFSHSMSTNPICYFIFAKTASGYLDIALKGPNAGTVYATIDGRNIHYALATLALEPFATTDACTIMRVDTDTITIAKNGTEWRTIYLPDFMTLPFDEICYGFLTSATYAGPVVTDIKVAEINFLDLLAPDTDALVNPSPSRYAEKRIGFLGDSITLGYQITKPYHQHVLSNLGLALARNYGVAGNRITKPDLNGESMCTRYANMDSTLDGIFLLAGTNDAYLDGGVPLGTFESTDNTTFYGACHQLFKGLVIKYTGKPIIIGTPLPRANQLTANSHGHILKDYVNAVREVAEYYSIPVVDLFSTYGINPAISDEIRTYWTREGDGLHPSEPGHKLLGDKVTQAFLNY